MSSSFATRFLVQLRTDLRLLVWPALFTALVIVLQLHYRVPPELATSASGQLQLLADAPLAWLTRLLPFALVLLALHADAPSNANTASLTRPIGGGAMWCAKLSALFLTISVPWALCDVYVASISPHSTGGWLAIIVSSLGNTLFMISVSAAIASLASSRRQLMLLAVTLLTLSVFGGDWLRYLVSEAISLHHRSPTLETCASIVACGVGLITALSVWWLATAQRDSRLVMSALGMGTVLSLIAGNVWPIDWLARPPLKVESKLALQFGQHDASNQPAGQPLWPTLHVAGLGEGEVCSILAFAPIIQGKPWPGETFVTDFQQKDSNPHRLQWVDNEHARALMHHYAASDLWPLAHSHNDPKRPELAQLITIRERPWLLRLAIHRMKRIADLPLAKVWREACDLPVHEGLALRLGPVSGHGEGWATTLSCGLHEMRSLLVPELDHAPLSMIKPSSIYGRNLPFNFMLVAHDPEARENTFGFADLAPYWGGRDSSWGLLVDRTHHRGMVFLYPPKARIALGFTTEERWLSTTTVQVWIAEERGTVDLELSAEQMKQVLTPAIPSPPSRSP